MKFVTFFIFITIFGLSYGFLEKLKPCLLEALKTKSHVDILIQFDSTEQVLKKFEKVIFKNKDERANTIVNALRIHSENSQKSLLEFLKSVKSPEELKTLLISNIIWVKSADLDLIREIASNSEVLKIFIDGTVTLDESFIPVNRSLTSEIEQSRTVEWGVEKIRAPDVWDQFGYDGTGSIVGIIDTGVYYGHNYLRRKYAGGWYDPYGETPSDPNPTDGNGHGTHCIGSVLGSSPDETHFTGVSPGAFWIACRGLDKTGSGTFAKLLACFEWMACQNPSNCFGQPDVVTNSWGGSSSTSDPVFDNVLAYMNTARILVVFAAGNSGSNCATIGFPANTENPMTTVGATDNSDVIAYFSSRGPAPKTVIKPHVSAPGVNIVSCWISDPDALASASGTSMATPHVAGLHALLRGTYSPYTNYDNDYIQTLVEHTCFQPSTVPTTCPTRPPGDPTLYPNNHYGWGRVDALNTFNAFEIAPSKYE